MVGDVEIYVYSTNPDLAYGCRYCEVGVEGDLAATEGKCTKAIVNKITVDIDRLGRDSAPEVSGKTKLAVAS